MAARVRHAMSLEQIAELERATPAAINTLTTRALKKLRMRGLIFTAKELSDHLDRSRREVE